MIFRRRKPTGTSDEKPPRRGYGVGLGNAMVEFEAVLNPAAEHRIVEMRRIDEVAEINWSGELDAGDDEPKTLPS